MSEPIILTAATAQQHQQAGNLREAEGIYHRLLEADPNHVAALHGLGGIAYLRSQFAEAVHWLQKAVAAEETNPALHSNLGAALRAAGQLADAEACYRRALRLQPDLAEASNNLGNILWAQGRFPEAAARYRLAALARPNYAEAYLNLSLALQAQGKAIEAVGARQQAARLKPELVTRGDHLREAPPTPTHNERAISGTAPTVLSDPSGAHDTQLPIGPPSRAEVLFQEARSLLAQKRWDEVIAQCAEALRLEPDAADVYVVLGRALANQVHLTEAASAFHQALRALPEHAEAAMYLGAALREQGHLERALGYLEYAIHLRPDLVEAHCHLGQVFTDKVQLREAAAAYREALRWDPHSVQALSHLGIVLQELSQPEEGHRLLEQALRLAPQDFKVHVHYGTSLVNQGHFERAKTHFLKALAIQPDCAAAYFFLARDSNHRFTKAELRRMQDLLEREHLPLHDRINLHFALARVRDRTRDFAESFRHCQQGNACKKQLLEFQGNAFHPDGHARFVDRLIAFFDTGYFQRARSFGISSNVPVFIVGMPRSGTSLVEQILASHPAVHGGGELRQIKHFTDALPAELSSSAEFPECLDRFDEATSRRLAQGYLQALHLLGGDKPRITDKLPLNFQNLGLIASLFPQAQIIHCRRDPRDVCWSCYFQNFREIAFACDLKTLGIYYRQYERLMAHWKQVLPVPILDVCYEDLVNDLERGSRDLLAFCKLPWHEGCLTFHETQRVVRTSSNIQVRQPVYRHSIGYWKHYEPYLAMLLEAL